MRLRVIPRSEGFYDLFEQAAANLADTSGLLLKLLTDFHDPEAAHTEIRQREHEGDQRREGEQRQQQSAPPAKAQH